MIFPNSIRHNRFLSFLLVVLVAFTNLSQLPYFVDGGITQLLAMPGWLLLVLYCLISGKYPNTRGTKVTISLFIFFLIIFGPWLIIDPLYQRSGLPVPIVMAMFILLVSTCLGKNLSQKDLDWIYTSYIVSTFVLGVAVYQEYLMGASFEGRGYLYESKNSTCQILLTAWILILFTKLKEDNKLLKMGYIFMFLFFTFEIFALKSRASMLGMPATLMIGMMSGKLDFDLRKYAFLILFSVFFYFLANPEMWDFVLENFILGGRDRNDLNDLSSGRADEWMNFLSDWENPFLGQGRCKRESLILTSLLEFGILGGITIMLIAIQPLLFVKKWYKRLRTDVNFLILFSVALSYTINGIFEQLAPFGPGVKCYFLWFLYGMITSNIFSKGSIRISN